MWTSQAATGPRRLSCRPVRGRLCSVASTDFLGWSGGRWRRSSAAEDGAAVLRQVGVVPWFVGSQHGRGPQPPGARLRRSAAVPVTTLRAAAASRRRTIPVQLVVYAAVGAALNVVYVLMYLPLREVVDAQTANAVSLVLSTILGTWGHRRVTFGVRGRRRTVPHQALGLVMLVFGLAVTAGSLWLLEHSVEDPTRTAELLVL